MDFLKAICVISSLLGLCGTIVGFAARKDLEVLEDMSCLHLALASIPFLGLMVAKITLCDPEAKSKLRFWEW